MLEGSAIAEALVSLGVTHVVWLPDSMLGTWERSIEARRELQLVRVCREGEAWAIAAGLTIGGKSPVVIMQSTGFFESGDAMRNVLYDLQIPLYSMVGYRSYLLPNSPDTAKRYLEPVVRAWGLDHILVENDDVSAIVAHYRRCEETHRSGVALLAEGKG